MSFVKQGVLLVAGKRDANNAVRAAFHPKIEAGATYVHQDRLPKGMETQSAPPAVLGPFRTKLKAHAKNASLGNML